MLIIEDMKKQKADILAFKRDENLIIPDKTKSILKGCIVPIGEQPRGGWWGSLLKNLAP